MSHCFEILFGSDLHAASVAVDPSCFAALTGMKDVLLMLCPGMMRLAVHLAMLIVVLLTWVVIVSFAVLPLLHSVTLGTAVQLYLYLGHLEMLHVPLQPCLCLPTTGLAVSLLLDCTLPQLAAISGPQLDHQLTLYHDTVQECLFELLAEAHVLDWLFDALEQLYWLYLVVCLQCAGGTLLILFLEGLLPHVSWSLCLLSAEAYHE